MIPIIKRYGLIPIFIMTFVGFIFIFLSIFFTYYYGFDSAGCVDTSNINVSNPISVQMTCSDRPDSDVCRANQAFTIICLISSSVVLFIFIRYFLSIWLSSESEHKFINSKFNGSKQVPICLFALIIASISQMIAFSMQILGKESTDPLVSSEYGIGFILSAQGTILYTSSLIMLIIYCIIHMFF